MITVGLLACPVFSLYADSTSTPFIFSSTETASSTFVDAPETIQVQFSDPTAAVATSTLVDFELFDQNDQRVATTTWENVVFGPSMSTTTLPFKEAGRIAPGVYTLKAGIFNAGWHGLLTWINSITSFAVLGTTTSPLPAGQQILIGGIWQEYPTLPGGTSQNFSAEFITSGANVPVYIEIYLLDNTDHIISDNSWDNVYLDRSYHTTESVVSPPLVPGTYHWGVALFSLGRKMLYNWQDNLAPFAVSSSQGTTTTQNL